MISMIDYRFDKQNKRKSANNDVTSFINLYHFILKLPLAESCPGVNSKCTEGLWCGEDTCEEPIIIDKSNNHLEKR